MIFNKVSSVTYMPYVWSPQAVVSPAFFPQHAVTFLTLIIIVV